MSSLPKTYKAAEIQAVKGKFVIVERPLPEPKEGEGALLPALPPPPSPPEPVSNRQTPHLVDGQGNGSQRGEHYSHEC